jgi:hypothetical protein
MKKMPSFLVLLLAVALVLGLAGCKVDDDDDKKEQGKVDFTNHQNASIRVRNNTNVRLVAFKGLPDNANLLGGIPANTTNHGLSRTGFNTSVDFALTLVTETEYKRAMSAGGNQAVTSAAIFNTIYAFYNHTGTNNNVFAINAQSGGIGRLILENPTAWNIEIRKDAYNGQTLGFIGPYTSTQTLNLEPADYVFYPVMRRFNPILGEIIDVQPVFPDGVIANTPYFQPLPISATPQTWNFLTIAQNATINMVSGAAFIRVVNNSQVGIQFYNGSTAQQTSMGFTQLAPGATMVFQVPFPRSPDNSFSITHTADFGVGVPGVGRTGAVPPRTVNMDWLYEIQVTGSNASNIVASDLEEKQKMDIEGLFNASTH